MVLVVGLFTSVFTGVTMTPHVGCRMAAQGAPQQPYDLKERDP